MSPAARSRGARRCTGGGLIDSRGPQRSAPCTPIVPTREIPATAQPSRIIGWRLLNPSFILGTLPSGRKRDCDVDASTSVPSVPSRTPSVSRHATRRLGEWDFRKVPEVASAWREAGFSLQPRSPESRRPADRSGEGRGRDAGAAGPSRVCPEAAAPRPGGGHSAPERR